MRTRGHALIAVAAGLVALAAAAVAGPAAVERLAGQVREASSLLEVGANPTRGQVVMCQRQFAEESVVVSTAIDIHHWRSEGKTAAEKRHMQEEYLRCFTGGRQAHRASPLMLEPHQTRSLDWGVEIDVEKNWTSNFIQATNTRDEPVVVHLEGEARNVTVEPDVPGSFRLGPKSTRQLVTVTRYTGVDSASFVFGWRAEPVRYLQSEQMVQLASKGVTVSVHHYPRRSVFTVFNSRDDVEPVKVAVDFKAMYGTNRKNLIVRDANNKWVRDSVMVRLEPGASQVVMTVRPRKIHEPWYFGWTYKWEAGDSPLEVFGLGDI